LQRDLQLVSYDSFPRLLLSYGDPFLGMTETKSIGRKNVDKLFRNSLKMADRAIGKKKPRKRDYVGKAKVIQTFNIFSSFF
jgi:hypothetical protein